MPECAGLSTVDLLALFHSLSDGPQAPSGVYDGQVWSPDYPLLARLANRLWRGKVFTRRGEAAVTNRILWFTAITGLLYHRSPCEQWEIDYPRLGLRDELRWADGYWLGRMHWRQGWIWFTLTAHAQTPAR